MPTVLYTADVVCPMAGPPVPSGGVLVDGDTILAVGDSAHLAADADRVHRGKGVLLPAMVDGATRLEWSDLDGLPLPAGTQPESADASTRDWDADRWQRSARRGVQEAVRAGAAVVADAVVRGPAVPVAVRAGLRGASHVEVHEVADADAGPVLEALDHALGLPAAGRSVGIGVRSPAGVERGVLDGVVGLAARRGAPLRVACARTRDEVEAVQRGHGCPPVQLLAEVGALGPGTTVVHGIWVSPEDVRRLADTRTTVVCTPQMDARLGAGQAPLEHYAETGTALALGTGGPPFTAADPLLVAAAWVDLAGERGLASWPGDPEPVTLAEQAIRLLTCEGAVSLGCPEAGVLAPGRRADLVAVAVAATPDDVYRTLVGRGAGRQVLTVIAGVARARRSPGQAWPAIDRRVSPTSRGAHDH